MNDRMSILATLGVAVAALSAAGVWVSWKSHTPQATARDQIRRLVSDPSRLRFRNVTHFPRSQATCGEVTVHQPDRQSVAQGLFIVAPDGRLRIDPPQLLPIAERGAGVDEPPPTQLIRAHCPGYA